MKDNLLVITIHVILYFKLFRGVVVKGINTFIVL